MTSIWRAMFFLSLISIFIAAVGCWGMQIPDLSVILESTTIPDPVLESTPTSIRETAGAEEGLRESYYDLNEPSSVEDYNELFNYLYSVTGRFNGIRFSTPRISEIPESLRRELLEKYPVFREDESFPIHMNVFASESESFGHGLIVGGNVLTASHVIEDNGSMSILENSPMAELPLDLISTVHFFLPLQEKGRPEPRVSYSLKKNVTYPERFITWLSPKKDSGLGDFQYSPIRVADEELQVDTFVYVVTYEGIKEGVIVPIRVVIDAQNLPSEVTPVISSISLRDGDVFKNGDSGAPVFVIREGKPYLAGQIEATHRDPFKRHLGVMINASFSRY